MDYEALTDFIDPDYKEAREMLMLHLKEQNEGLDDAEQARLDYLVDEAVKLGEEEE